MTFATVWATRDATAAAWGEVADDTLPADFMSSAGRPSDQAAWLALLKNAVAEPALANAAVGTKRAARRVLWELAACGLRATPAAVARVCGWLQEAGVDTMGTYAETMAQAGIKLADIAFTNPPPLLATALQRVCGALRPSDGAPLQELQTALVGAGLQDEEEALRPDQLCWEAMLKAQRTAKKAAPWVASITATPWVPAAGPLEWRFSATADKDAHVPVPLLLACTSRYLGAIALSGRLGEAPAALITQYRNVLLALAMVEPAQTVAAYDERIRAIVCSAGEVTGPDPTATGGATYLDRFRRLQREVLQEVRDRAQKDNARKTKDKPGNAVFFRRFAGWSVKEALVNFGELR